MFKSFGFGPLKLKSVEKSAGKFVGFLRIYCKCGNYGK
jgi:hypothetical protein